MYDINNFSLKDMVKCSDALRDLGEGAESMEEVANRVVTYIYDHLIVKDTGEKAIALARFFKTHHYVSLDDELREFARSMLDAQTEFPEMKCLALLASAGMRQEWCSRRQSLGHKAIPLPSEHFVEQFPMVRQLIQQMGLDVNTILQPDPDIIMDLEQCTYNVFAVPDAVNSKYVPAQEEFVIPYGVKSVLGFGGILPSGNLFTVIMFSRVRLGRKEADMFAPLALSVKLAVLPFEGNDVFA